MIESRAQGQHLGAHQRIGRAILAITGRVLDGVRLLEGDPDLTVRSPNHPAAQDIMSLEPELEPVGNAEAALHLECRGLFGQPAHDAVDRRLAEIEEDFPTKERPFRDQTGHSRSPRLRKIKKAE